MAIGLREAIDNDHDDSIKDGMSFPKSAGSLNSTAMPKNWMIIATMKRATTVMFVLRRGKRRSLPPAGDEGNSNDTQRDQRDIIDEMEELVGLLHDDTGDRGDKKDRDVEKDAANSRFPTNQALLDCW